MSTIGERIEQVRISNGLKGIEFAEKLGLPYRSYMNYKSGRTPPAEVLAKLLELFPTDPMWLLTGKGDGPQASVLTNVSDNEPPEEGLWDVVGAEGADEETPPDEKNEVPAPELWRMTQKLLELHEENAQLRKRNEDLERRVRMLLIKLQHNRR